LGSFYDNLNPNPTKEFHKVLLGRTTIGQFGSKLFIISGMGSRTALAGLALLAVGALASAQTLNNQSLSGKYYFRQVSLALDSSGNPADARTLTGTVLFDGNGGFTFTGQFVQGNTAPVSIGRSGNYSVDPAGFVTMDSPVRGGAKINARLGPEALLGSSTESGDAPFDLFAAIPAPTVAPALGGPYWVATLELPGGNASNPRSAIFSLAAGTSGQINSFTANGHAAATASGQPATQTVGGATYVLNTDGSGNFNFGTGGALLSGSKAFYLSADGNVILGGAVAAGAHEILLGAKAASGVNQTAWNGDYWSAGLRVDGSDFLSYAGSAAARGAGTLTLTRRIKETGFGAYDFTGINGYSLAADGSGTVELTKAGLGAGAKMFVAIALSAADPGAYAIDFGAQMASFSGTGVFLNPKGVLNAASFAPAGNPISPGEFLTLYGAGLAPSTATAKPPYPPSSNNGVIVLINNVAAPLYYVSPTQINCLVPFGTEGPSATIVVQNGTAASNKVTVPVAASSPGIYAINEAGSGPGAILHADYTLVSAAQPAISGETVLVYLTGMGAVSPTVADGTAGGSNPLNRTTISPVNVYVGGQPATVVYSGLAPGYPGLYQINVTLPALAVSGNVPLAIQTSNAFHDQVDIPMH
jgi:uncharacterized protein (TIGR03437 family)